jgi:tRNA(His) guanylyltransferase
MMDLSDRMKGYYENCYRIFLPRRTYTIIRVDGKSFKSYTNNLNEPFDDGLINDMNETAKYLCKNIQGSKFAYVQSDEISILITDFEKLTTSAWFDNNLLKMTSVSASLATSKFNQLRIYREMVEVFDQPTNILDVQEAIKDIKLAEFDSRVFQISTKIEVYNYFLWRQQDATRNSILKVGQTYLGKNKLKNLSCKNIQEILFTEKGLNWNDYDSKYKRGRMIAKNSDNKWDFIDVPIFSQEQEFLLNLIPDNI